MIDECRAVEEGGAFATILVMPEESPGIAGAAIHFQIAVASGIGKASQNDRNIGEYSVRKISKQRDKALIICRAYNTSQGRGLPLPRN